MPEDPNIALNVLDQEWARRGHHLGVLVRYADDTVVLRGTADRAEQARLLMAEILATLGLQLHPDKTGIVRAPRALRERLGCR